MSRNYIIALGLLILLQPACQTGVPEVPADLDGQIPGSEFPPDDDFLDFSPPSQICQTTWRSSVHGVGINLPAVFGLPTQSFYGLQDIFSWSVGSHIVALSIEPLGGAATIAGWRARTIAGVSNPMIIDDPRIISGNRAHVLAWITDLGSIIYDVAVETNDGRFIELAQAGRTPEANVDTAFSLCIE